MSLRNHRTEARFLRGQRAFIGALVALSLLLSAAPASSYNADDVDAAGQVSPVWDLLMLRPLGIVATATGVVALAVGLPILLITRPTDIAGPFELLIMKPVRYTWGDPLGDHSGSM